jgi:succinyl-diaminopimelate desuccinylase
MGLEARPTGAEAEEAVALLRALVREDSVNPPGDVGGPARVALAALERLSPEVIAADARKPNVAVRLENGPGPTVHLNAHLDTVPPGDLAAWTVPTHDLTEREGRLHGLGTGNMKGAAAAMILALRRLGQAREAWRGTVILSLVADECVFGPHGASHLLAARPDLRGDALICGEGPGHMELAVAEKGLMWVRLRAKGRVGQGMLTSAEAVRRRGSPTRWRSSTGGTSFACARRCPRSTTRRTPRGCGFRPTSDASRVGRGSVRRCPWPRRRWTCGSRQGSRWPRWARGSTRWGWTGNWRRAGRRTGRTREVPRPPPCGRWQARVRGRRPLDVTRLPASDASRWRALGVPAVCYGPQPELASGVDDFVRRDDLLDCVAVYAGAVAHLSR